MPHVDRIEALQSILSSMPQIDEQVLGPDDRAILRDAAAAIRRPVALAGLRSLVAWVEEVSNSPVDANTQSTMLAAIERGAGFTEIVGCLDDEPSEFLWSRLYTRIVEQGRVSLQVEVDPDRLVEAEIPDQVIAQAGAVQRVLARSMA